MVLYLFSCTSLLLFCLSNLPFVPLCCLLCLLCFPSRVCGVCVCARVSVRLCCTCAVNYWKRQAQRGSETHQGIWSQGGCPLCMHGPWNNLPLNYLQIQAVHQMNWNVTLHISCWGKVSDWLWNSSFVPSPCGPHSILCIQVWCYIPNDLQTQAVFDVNWHIIPDNTEILFVFYWIVFWIQTELDLMIDHLKSTKRGSKLQESSAALYYRSLQCNKWKLK